MMMESLDFTRVTEVVLEVLTASLGPTTFLNSLQKTAIVDCDAFGSNFNTSNFDFLLDMDIMYSNA